MTTTDVIANGVEPTPAPVKGQAQGDWKARAAAYKQAIYDAIPPEWRLDASVLSKYKPGSEVRFVAQETILTKDEIELLARDATTLAADIAAGKFTAVATATAYCKAAAVAHQVTGCLMDFFPEEAIARAKELDEYLAKNGKTMGPLHGVPVSVKDMVAVKGRRMTAGFLAIAEGPDGISPADATLVAAFRAAGAVFYAKTTNPQAIMHLETDSFLGPTVNPLNTALTCGGSSGGEAALMAAGAAVLGIGTDIGGSIRNPCANCGLYGFKPTAARLPRGGMIGGMPNQESIVGATGPQTVSARDMKLFIETVLATEPWRIDPGCVGMPWKEVKGWRYGGSKPRVGVMWDDGLVSLQPPMRRTLREAVDKLKAAGFDLVDVKPYKSREAWELINTLYFTDGGKRVRDLCAATGEPILPLTQWVMQNAREIDATELRSLVKTREAFRAAYNQYWNEHEIDVLLCAPGYGTAQPLGTTKYWNYTSFFNLVDYPAGVFPASVVKPDDDRKESKTEFLSDMDKYCSEIYDPEVFWNAPVGLQVVGQRWDDEATLEALTLIAKTVRA